MSTARRVAVTVLLAAAALSVAAPAGAHPLGNFTVNQFVGVAVVPGAVEVDYVVDMAEIPTFQELREFDGDRDGALSPEEAAAYADRRCRELAPGLETAVDRGPLALASLAGTAELLPGQAGLTTLRLECAYRAPASGDAGPATLEVVNRNFDQRLGWREIEVGTAAARPTGIADRLQAYPDDLLRSPPDVRSATVPVVLVAAGEEPPAPAAPDPGTAHDDDPVAAPRSTAVVRPPDAFASLITKAGLGPLALAAGLAAAFALGIGHALAPGHGKTIMAAYLVGTSGTGRQAGVLALAVAISHTAGVLVLGLVTLAATAAWQPDAVYPWLSLVAGLVVLGVGISLLVRRGHSYDHGHGHAHHHDHAADPMAADREVGWKALAALGLSGGLVPSASAVVLLLGAVHLERVALGVALIVAFGLGMAATLVGVGLLLVYAGRAGLRRLPSGPGLDAVPRRLRLVMGLVVVALGLVMTLTALRPILG